MLTRDDSLQSQLIKYLTDAYSIEQLALAQVREAADRVTDPSINAVLRLHLNETEEQGQLLEACLKRAGAKVPGEDFFGSKSGKSPATFISKQPDTTGKILVYISFYAHMKIAAYELVEFCAAELGETRIATVARRISLQEQEMTRRLSTLYDNAVSASLAERRNPDLDDHLNRALTDVYAIEEQTMKLLSQGKQLAAGELLEAFRDHHDETKRYKHMVFGRMRKREVNPSMLRDAERKLGELNWNAFSRDSSETLAELAGFIYASEHLEITSYELLRRIAERAADVDTVIIVDGILANERSSAERVRSLLDVALETSLREKGYREIAIAV
jgi:ferritin-like metal-binding protein YciE